MRHVDDDLPVGGEPAAPEVLVVSGELAGHRDRLRWDARYAASREPNFTAHPLAARAFTMAAPDGPVADLACGTGGATLLAAGTGRHVTAVDVSEVALRLLDEQVRRRGLAALVTLVHADLRAWTPAADRYAALVCTGYWDRQVFAAATRAVAPGGVLAWEAFTAAARRSRPTLPAAWCLADGEPRSLLPSGFETLDGGDVPGARRRLLAKRAGPAAEGAPAPPARRGRRVPAR